MEKVATITARKQIHFNKISPDSSIRYALGQINGKKIEYLIVMDEDEKFLGLITEHDITKRAIFTKRPISEMRVREIMNPMLPFVDVNDSLKHCMRLMKQFSIHYLPVFEGLNFRGIISSDDILQEVLYEREEIFE